MFVLLLFFANACIICGSSITSSVLCVVILSSIRSSHKLPFSNLCSFSGFSPHQISVFPIFPLAGKVVLITYGKSSEPLPALCLPVQFCSPYPRHVAFLLLAVAFRLFITFCALLPFVFPVPLHCLRCL